MHFTGAKSSPFILFLLMYKICLARMKASYLMQCIITEKKNLIKLSIKWASTRENCLRGFANNTGADQPAHPRSLISAFVIRFVEIIICKLSTGEI